MAQKEHRFDVGDTTYVVDGKTPEAWKKLLAEREQSRKDRAGVPAAGGGANA